MFFLVLSLLCLFTAAHGYRPTDVLWMRGGALLTDRDRDGQLSLAEVNGVVMSNDLDGDGVIPYAEWFNAWVHVKPYRAPPGRTLSEMAEALFRFCDAGSNDRVLDSQDVYRMWLKSDSNKDGILSVEELVQEQVKIFDD